MRRPSSPHWIRRAWACAPPDPLAGEHAFIDYRNLQTDRPCHWELHRGRQVVRIPTPGRLIVSDVATLHSVCATGWGLAQVLEVGVAALLASGALIPVLGEWSDERFAMHAVYPSRSYVPGKTRVFVAFLVSVLRPGTPRPGRR